MRAIIYFLLASSGALALDLCRRKAMNTDIVCVCTKDYCDPLYAPESDSADEYLLVSTAKLGDRFAHRYGKIAKNILIGSPISDTTITIDPSKTYQKIIGFGGGFSASVVLIAKQLPKKLKEYLYTSYYSKTFGIGYDYMRISIASSDFDIDNWAYNEHPVNDILLTNFTKIDPRELDRNNELNELKRVSNNPGVKLLAAAWSAPPWMKLNHKWIGGPLAQLLPQYYQTWADYHVKWLDAMFKSGTPVWAITTGNEPCSSAGTDFESMYWQNANHAKWIAENMGPTLARSPYSHVELHGFDELRESLLKYLEDVEKSNKKALDYIKTWDIHGYSDSRSPPEILSIAHAKYPTKPIFYTENSYYVESTSIPSDPAHFLWGRASDQCLNMIKNFNNFMAGYIDWNLIVNRKGGPNTQQNYVDAPIIASLDLKKIYKQPLFYSLAHFAKFITPESVRIHSDFDPSKLIQTTAFLRPDGKIVVILQNLNPLKDLVVSIVDLKKGSFTVKVDKDSINTIVYSAA